MNISALREATKRPRGNINEALCDKPPTMTKDLNESKCNVVKPTARKAAAPKDAQMKAPEDAQPKAPMSKSDGKKPMSYARGGKVSKTGSALVHKNEVVLPVNLVKQLRNLMK